MLRLFRKPIILTLGSLLGAIFLGSVPTAPAAAEVIHEEIAVVQLLQAAQTFEVAETVVAAPVERDGFGVTVYDIVSWPIISTATSDCFGCRGGSHHGTDFVPGGGTPITSIAAGTVIQSGWNGGYGNCVTIQHSINGNLVTSLYGHMAEASGLAVGQHVAVGQYIGPVGSTGTSTGNHLHLEITVNGALTDPEAWLYANVNDYLFQ